MAPKTVNNPLQAGGSPDPTDDQPLTVRLLKSILAKWKDDLIADINQKLFGASLDRTLEQQDSAACPPEASVPSSVDAIDRNSEEAADELRPDSHEDSPPVTAPEVAVAVLRASEYSPAKPASPAVVVGHTAKPAARSIAVGSHVPLAPPVPGPCPSADYWCHLLLVGDLIPKLLWLRIHARIRLQYYSLKMPGRKSCKKDIVRTGAGRKQNEQETGACF